MSRHSAHGTRMFLEVYFPLCIYIELCQTGQAAKLSCLDRDSDGGRTAGGNVARVKYRFIGEVNISLSIVRRGSFFRPEEDLGSISVRVQTGPLPGNCAKWHKLCLLIHGLQMNTQQVYL